ncbi:OmpP1/FadL family transporter [Hasllibacter sp. MH4015]|uniref:OmpP1/FadL family transporter n=1 Tax=Hasllibacter sp. MH4015 TaxID=2854029 RepID=UPI001CD4BC83|nr:hypothetical protein [Hasllibacter sp. MH4015]
MTRFTITAAAALLATTSLAQAGGLDRSILNVSPLFEDGNYFEFSFSAVIPEVTGTLGPNTSGDMADDYFNAGFAYRHEISDTFAVALIYSNAYGADVNYTNTSVAYPVQGFTASLTGNALSVLGQYQFNENISVYGGLRYVSMSAETGVASVGNVNDYAADGALGYVVGAAYEIPDIALRASLTYTSATTHDNSITVNGPNALTVGATQTGEYTMPQSLALDFQTGVAEGTLVLASIRWTDWTETMINTQSSLGTIDYDNDTWAYSIGAARRLSEELAVVGTISYEASSGLPASNLSPTDGQIGVSVAGIYDLSDQVTLTGGLNYTFLGDATTEGVGATFADNRAFGVGFRIGYNF